MMHTLMPLHEMEAEQARRSRNKFAKMFPDAGPYSREKYAPHTAFLAAGATYPERCFMAANRSGKTETGAYEMTCHLTGNYPEWWTGKRFAKPVDAWAGGVNNLTTRDVIQEKLLGKPGEFGTGMIPGDSIIHVANKQGLPNAVDTIYVRHRSGGRSQLGLKSYEQGRESWQGTAKHVIWLDEEPELAVYIEALLRTATTGGILMLTFTPLLGMSDVVKSFLEADEAARAVKYIVSATWEDAPHLSAQARAALIASIPPYQRDARTKGIPQLGVGAIYPLALSEVTVPRFDIPAHWRRMFGMDVGWKATAAVWIADDLDTGTSYLYHEYKRGQAEPVVHAAAIKAPGAWIAGVIDPACMGSGQIDGRNLMEMYRELGLELEPAANAVESGIYAVWGALSTGRLKIFDTCTQTLSEFAKYHRDEKGRIVKADDHLLDSLRYAVASGTGQMKTAPVKREKAHVYSVIGSPSTSWMG
jgi:phage terminase large subunit-like protein